MGPPRPRGPCWGSGGRGRDVAQEGRGVETAAAGGWRPSLPLPLVTAPARRPVTRTYTGDRLRRGLLRLPLPASPTLPPSARIPAPGPARAPNRRGFACRGWRRASRGLRAPQRRLNAPALTLSLATLSRLPPRAPLSRYSGPPLARAQFSSRQEVSHKGSWAIAPSPGFASPSFSPIP